MTHPSLLANCPLGYALHETILDSDGSIIDYKFLDGNEEFLASLDRTRDETIGYCVKELFPDLDTMAPHWMKMIQELMSTGTPQIREEYSYAKKRFYHVHLWKNSDATFSSLFIDITEKKNLEIAEADSVRQEFIQTQKLMTLGQISGKVAHDFGNLITILSGLNQAIESESYGNHFIQHYTKKVRDVLETSHSLVKQLLAFFRPQLSNDEIVSGATICERGLDILKFARNSKIDFEFIQEQDNLYVQVDANLVISALVNLGLNALDAMPNGGKILLHLGSRDKDTILSWNKRFTKNVEFSPYKNFMMIQVQDSGIGIAEEDLDRIIEPYHTTKELGTGLGLPNVIGILERYDGILAYDSTPGEGSEFCMLIPLLNLGRS